jgi:hypothetical protein
LLDYIIPFFLVSDKVFSIEFFLSLLLIFIYFSPSFDIHKLFPATLPSLQARWRQPQTNNNSQETPDPTDGQHGTKHNQQQQPLQRRQQQQ